MGWKKLYANLLARLQLLPANVGRLELLLSIQTWLRGSLDKLTPELRACYGLDEYALLDLCDYPINDTSLVPAEELQRLRAVAPVSMETLAMRIRDVFWSGITVESSIQCPRCNEASLRILEDPLTGGGVYACDLCGWAQVASGEPWSNERHARPARKELVAAWRDNT